MTQQFLPPASGCPPIEIMINDIILGTVVTMNEWIGNELSRLQNRIRPRHCENFDELVALIEEPKLFESLKAPTQPRIFLNHHAMDDDDDDDDGTNDHEEKEDNQEDDDEEDGDEDDDDVLDIDQDITAMQGDGIIINRPDNISAAVPTTMASSPTNITTATTTTTTSNNNNNNNNTNNNANTTRKRHLKSLPPTWLCQVFIEIMRYCRVSATINNAPRLLLTEFDKLRLNVKLGKAINANEFREKVLAILFGNIKMTEHLVKCWKLMCEWVTRPQHAMIKWVEMSLSAYIAAQRLVMGEYLLLRKQQEQNNNLKIAAP